MTVNTDLYNADLLTDIYVVYNPCAECLYASGAEMRKFIDEALTMAEFNHEHVLQLIGIVIDGEKMPLVVLPFMSHGDLLSYIRDENNVSRVLLIQRLCERSGN